MLFINVKLSHFNGEGCQMYFKSFNAINHYNFCCFFLFVFFCMYVNCICLPYDCFVIQKMF